MFMTKKTINSIVINKLFSNVARDKSRTLKYFENTKDVDQCYDFCIDAVQSAYLSYKQIFPNKKSRKRWINGHLLKLIKKSNLL